MRSFLGLVVWGLVAALPILAPVTPAWSHASLVKSSPANAASLGKAPTEIRAWFSEELKVKGSTLRLYDSHQKLMASGGIDPAVAKHDVMKLAVPHVVNGAYVVKWHAISADDNEPTNGSFKFSIGMGAQTGTAPMADLPWLHLITPANGAHITNPVAVVVETPGNIDHLTMGGDMAGMSGMGPGVHLHIVVDNQAFMPPASKLTKVGPDRYRYVVGPLAAGTHTIKVFWADNKTHEAVGPVQTAKCTIGG
jgi:methionine-rich copper-binding protein CopC